MMSSNLQLEAIADQSTTLWNQVNQITFGSQNVFAWELTRMAINSCSVLAYQNQENSGINLRTVDARFQVFARIEVSLLNYHLSLISTSESMRSLIQETLNVGYSLAMAINSTTLMREVLLRTAFLDQFFFHIEYFIQQMNKHHNFISRHGSKTKQQYFLEMLRHFGLESSKFQSSELKKIIECHFPSAEKAALIAADCDNRDAPLGDYYTYLAAIRNSLHNNGYSNKRLNNWSLGVVKFEKIEAGEALLCQGCAQVIALTIPLIRILERIVLHSIQLDPDLCIIDPYTEALQKITSDSATQTAPSHSSPGSRR